jgi:hypothetical protein
LREYRARAWLAWHVAALGRVKRMPKLERLMPKQKPPEQSIDQQMAIMRAWKERRDRMIEALKQTDSANG